MLIVPFKLKRIWKSVSHLRLIIYWMQVGSLEYVIVVCCGEEND